MPDKTVLLVDDSAALRLIAGQLLTEAGYQVLEADDGTKALQLLDGRKIDLIITDVYMPELDGLALIKQVKQLSAYRFTPIMLLTREAADGPKLQAQLLGAKAWVVKPFSAPQLLQAVAKIVS
ncbi:response regulator [Rheinheimera sp.]|uniref:response regulator n=1 Tax=Rheinheimera sp. TaxID=1869214 RepID=UPI0027B9C4D9|nr:response regulator [Rheinheimera sp.]